RPLRRPRETAPPAARLPTSEFCLQTSEGCPTSTDIPSRTGGLERDRGRREDRAAAALLHEGDDAKVLPLPRGVGRRTEPRFSRATGGVADGAQRSDHRGVGQRAPMIL